MDFNQKLGMCLVAQVRSQARGNPIASMWVGRAEALVSLVLSGCGDLSESTAEEIAEEFAIESLIERALSGGLDGAACARYLEFLPGFPRLDMSEGRFLATVPACSRENHAYKLMQVATKTLIKRLCEAIKDLSSRPGVPDVFYGQSADELDRGRRALSEGSEIEAACVGLRAGAESNRL